MSSPKLIHRPPVPVHVELPAQPHHDGRFVEVSFSKLGDTVTYLNDAVDTLSKGLRNVHDHLAANDEIWKRLENLENAPKPEATVIREAAPPPPAPEKVEIPYIPSNDDIAGIALKAVTPVIEGKVAELQDQMDEKFDTLSKRVKALEDIETNRKDPLARMQKYFQEIGFLPKNEPEESDPLVLLGQVFVLLRQDIAKCPTIKDLEDAVTALKNQISGVESTLKADIEEKAKIAAAESAQIREDLEKIAKQVQALIQKNIDDGDVAGGLRDLTIRVDKIEDLLRKKETEKKKVVEEAPVVEQKPREKGFLEKLASVDLEEEVRRLRSMVECMEAAMPYETRQTLEYLRSGKGRPDSPNMEATMPNGQSTLNMSTANFSDTLLSGGVDLRQETEDQLMRFKETQGRELHSVMKVLKNQEKTIDALDAKVLDLWQRLPKVLAFLEPLQGQMEATMNDGMYMETLQDSTGGGPNKTVTFANEGEGGTGSDISNTNMSTTNIFAATIDTRGKNNTPAMSGTIDTKGKSFSGKGTGQLPALQQPPGWDKGRHSLLNLSGFMQTMNEADKSHAGTGEVGGPLKEMGSLTGLIKMALQRTTDDIHADLRQELFQLRQEMLGRLDLKADKTELQAILSRIDELTKKSKRIKEFSSTYSKDRERSVSPNLDKSADTKNEANLSDVRQGSPPSPGLPLTTSASSPNVMMRTKGHSCHENCKVPTCPKAMQMHQSLNRLPALKVVQ